MIRTQPSGDGWNNAWNNAWAIVMGICLALAIVGGFMLAKDVYGQEPEPIPTPDSLPLATGTTLFRVDGLIGEEHVDGTTLAAKDSLPRMAAMGFVAVNYSLLEGETVRTTVTAETENRERLEVTPFADGYRVDGTGKVWADIEVRYSRSITVEGQALEVITRIERDEITFVIEDTSGPDPPKPDPDEDDDSGQSPFSEPGLRVMIVYERDNLASLDPEQTAIIYSAPLREYFHEVCEEFRIVDQDIEAAPGGGEIWMEALERPRDSLPWILIGNGKEGFEGPLPESIEATKELVSKYE